MYVFIYLHIILSIYLSVNLPTNLFIYQTTHPTVYEPLIKLLNKNNKQINGHQVKKTEALNPSLLYLSTFPIIFFPTQQGHGGG